MAPEVAKEAEGEPQDQAERIDERIDGGQQSWHRRRDARAAAGTLRSRSGVSPAGTTGGPWNMFCQSAHGRI